MQIATQNQPYQPRIVIGEITDQGQGTIRIKGAELYAQALIIGQDVTLADCERMLEDVSVLEVPSYDGNLIEQLEYNAALIEASQDTAQPPKDGLLWSPSLGFVKPGTVVIYGQRSGVQQDGTPFEIAGDRYEVIQLHQTQAGWEPPLVPALYKLLGAAGAPPDEIPVWVPPTGAHDVYKLNDKVMFGGQVWVSTHPANSWQPGIYGWEVVK